MTVESLRAEFQRIRDSLAADDCPYCYGQGRRIYFRTSSPVGRLDEGECEFCGGTGKVSVPKEAEPMTILVYKRDGTIQVLEEYRDLNINSRSIEVTRLAFLRDGGSHTERIDRSSVVKIEVLI